MICEAIQDYWALKTDLDALVNGLENCGVDGVESLSVRRTNAATFLKQWKARIAEEQEVFSLK